MKKVLVCALAALFLMATCLTAFAEPVTTTSYVDNKLVVTTTIDDANDGDMLTYLAYQSEDATIEDDEIIYIDQKTFEEGKTTTFSYTADKDAWVGTVVKSGSSAASDPYSTTLEGRTITVEFAGADSGSYEFTLANEGASVTTTTLTTSNDWSVDEQFKGYVSKDGDYFVITDSDASLEDGTTITITTTIPYTYDPAVAEGSIGKVFKVEDGETTVEKLTVFGEVKTDVTDVNGTWGGILVTADESVATGTFDVSTATKYEAKARKGDANGYTFAVQLVNTSGVDDLTAKSHWARIYVVDSEGDYKYGAVIPFVVEVE